jgi:hypothetical protein
MNIDTRDESFSAACAAIRTGHIVMV